MRRRQLVAVALPALVALAAACWIGASCRDDELAERALCAPLRRLARLAPSANAFVGRPRRRTTTYERMIAEDT